MDIDEVADELYGLHPSEFTTARDERAGAARAAGDRTLAAAIKALRRPTASAWVANLLVRAMPAEIDNLVELGGALRAAQEELAGDQLRQLNRQRHQVVSALIGQARALVRDSGRSLGADTEREVEATLEAALADPAAGEAVRSGRLTTALAYSGLGPVDVTGVVATPPATTRPERAGRRPGGARPAPTRDRAALGAAEAAVRDAESAAAAADRDAAARDRELAEARDRLGELRRRTAELTEQLSRLRDEQAAAERAATRAERAHDKATAAASAAREQERRARAALDRLRD